MKSVKNNKLADDIKVYNKKGKLIRTEKRDNFRPNMKHGGAATKHGKGWH